MTEAARCFKSGQTGLGLALLKAAPSAASMSEPSDAWCRAIRGAAISHCAGT